MTQSPHLITRRRSLELMGAGSAGLLISSLADPGRAGALTRVHDRVAHAAGACVLTAEQEEGPFYVAVDDVRSDLVLGQSGLPFELAITIVNAVSCQPISGAAVDIWHANAAGLYSDILSENTHGETFCRGVQFTDRHGRVTFTTIFPGHYQGRTTHIHARIHMDARDHQKKLVGGHVAHTGQIFPSDAVNAEVYGLAPYSSEAARVVTHAQDRVYTGQHGAEGLMKMAMAGSRLAAGLTGTVTLAVNPKATPAPIGATSSAATVAGDG